MRFLVIVYEEAGNGREERQVARAKGGSLKEVVDECNAKLAELVGERMESAQRLEEIWEATKL